MANSRYDQGCAEFPRFLQLLLKFHCQFLCSRATIKRPYKETSSMEMGSRRTSQFQHIEGPLQLLPGPLLPRLDQTILYGYRCIGLRPWSCHQSRIYRWTTPDC